MLAVGLDREGLNFRLDVVDDLLETSLVRLVTGNCIGRFDVVELAQVEFGNWGLNFKLILFVHY